MLEVFHLDACYWPHLSSVVFDNVLELYPLPTQNAECHRLLVYRTITLPGLNRLELDRYLLLGFGVFIKPYSLII